MLIRLFRQHPVAASAFVLASALCIYFAVRLVVFTVFWADPAHRQQSPEAWMTPRYVAHSWHLDPSDVAKAVGLTERPDQRPTLSYIADQRGVPIEVVLAEIHALIAQKAARHE